MNQPSTPVSPTNRLAIHRSIAGRLLAWFLVISLVPCVALAVITARIATQALEDSVREKLVQIAAAKSNELETYALERLADASAMTGNVGMRQAMQRLNEFAASGSTQNPNINIDRTATALGYKSLLLIDTAGIIRLSVDPTFTVGTSILTGDLATSELTAGFDRARTLLQSEITAFQPYGTSREPMMFITNPIISGDGRVIGVSAGALGPKQVWRMLADVTGLGDSGEIITVQGDTAGVIVTAPTRSDNDAAFKLRLAPGSPSSAVANDAASGSRGYGTTTDYRGTEVVAAWCYLPSYRWGMLVKQDASEAFALLNFQRNVIFSLTIAVVIGVVLTALLVARSISTPIRAAVAVARQVASGDLRAEMGTTSADETGALLDAIHTMTTDLRALIGRIQMSTATLDATATVMQSTGAEQKQVIEDHGAATAEACAAVHQISTTSQELLRTMNEVNEMASNTGHRAEEGRANLAGMDSTMQQLAKSTALFGDKLTKIRESADRINLVIVTMAKVANQTNLLSINAAIEAEKAGEHGLGFLVVAREIAYLATQTAVASLDIERMVREMEGSVKAGVKEMGTFSTQVQGGVEEIRDISRKLGEIISAVQGISGRFEQVTVGMRAQSLGADQIRDAMGRLAEGTARTASALGDFNSATTHLRDAVDGLDNEVSRFTT
jgi:methyl-accepting chemotaxis protein WspA